MRVIKKKGFSCFKMTRAIRNNNHAKQTNPKDLAMWWNHDTSAMGRWTHFT